MILKQRAIVILISSQIHHENPHPTTFRQQEFAATPVSALKCLRSERNQHRLASLRLQDFPPQAPGWYMLMIVEIGETLLFSSYTPKLP